jgi:hypothetical protein
LSPFLSHQPDTYKACQAPSANRLVRRLKMHSRSEKQIHESPFADDSHK